MAVAGSVAHDCAIKKPECLDHGHRYPAGVSVAPCARTEMTVRVNGDRGFRVVASTHEFPEDGAAVMSTLDHPDIRGLGTALQRSDTSVRRYLPPRIRDARGEIPSLMVAQVPGCAVSRKLLQLFGESRAGRGQLAARYRKRHGQSPDVPDACQLAGNSRDRDVDGLAARCQPSESTARPSWASLARSMMVLERPS